MYQVLCRLTVSDASQGYFSRISAQLCFESAEPILLFTLFLHMYSISNSFGIKNERSCPGGDLVHFSYDFLIHGYEIIQ